MTTILVTGGCGYLGRHVVKYFQENGHTVVALDRKKPLDGVPCIIADITDKDELEAVFKEQKPDFVIHLAAVNEVVCQQNPRLAFDVNCFGTMHVLEAAREVGVKRVLYMSTFHVYGRATGTIDEETTPEPTHPYGISKLVGEYFCRDAAKKGQDVVILRSANGVGVPLTSYTDRWKLVVPALCKEAQEKKTITLNTPGHQERDFLPFSDTLQAMEILLEAPRSDDPVYNLGSGKPVSIRALAEMIQKEYNDMYGEEIPLNVPSGDEQTAPLDFQFERLKKLGYVPGGDLRDVIREILKYCERFR